MKKKFLFAILTLLFPVFVWAWGTIIISGNVPSGTTCGSFSSGNLLNETFDTNPGYDNTWTEAISGGTVDEDENTTPSASECGFDGEWLEIELPTGTWGKALTYSDLTSSQSIIYIRFVLYIESEDLADSDSTYCFIARDNSSYGDATNAAIKIGQSAGNLQLEFVSGYSVRDTYVISTGTTYCVEAFWDNTYDAWEWKINGVSQGSGSANPEIDFQRLRFGMGDVATNLPIHYYIDHFDVSSTGWLGCDQ